jgi:uncharacterized protein (DUF305 family)
MSEQLVARTEGLTLDGRQGPSAAARRNLYITIAAAALLIGAAFLAGWAIAGSGGVKSPQLATQPATTAQSAGSAFTGLTNNSAPYDLRFLDEMIAHHEGAIISVQTMITNSTHPELRDLGNHIVTTQQQQIDQMLAWREQWYPGAPALNIASLNMGMDMMSGGLIGGWMMGRSVLTDTGSIAPYSGMMSGGWMMGGRANLTPGTNQGSDGGYGMMGGRFVSGDVADRMFLRMMIPHHQLAIDMAQDALLNAQHPELKTLAQSIISGQSAEITEMEGYLKTWYGEDSTRNLAAPMREMMQWMLAGAGN